MKALPTYDYANAAPGYAHAYLLPAVLRALKRRPEARRIFEIGCGNGAIAAALQVRGYAVTGVDTSETGIAEARRAHPGIDLHVGSAYDDLAERFGTFPLVLSLEVVEHLYFPRRLAENAFRLLDPGGVAIISTPYHAYLKNRCSLPLS